MKKRAFGLINFRDKEEREELIRKIKERGYSLSGLGKRLLTLFVDNGFEIRGDRILICGEFTKRDLEKILSTMK